MASTATPAAVIEPQILYRLEEAKRVTGWGTHGMRQARRRGLNVMYLGRHGYVKGEELIRHIQEHAKPPQ